MNNEPYGIGKSMLEYMTREELQRLYNSGMMAMPMTKEGYWDFETLKKSKIKYNLDIIIRRHNNGC